MPFNFSSPLNHFVPIVVSLYKNGLNRKYKGIGFVQTRNLSKNHRNDTWINTLGFKFSSISISSQLISSFSFTSSFHLSSHFPSFRSYNMNHQSSLILPYRAETQLGSPANISRVKPDGKTGRFFKNVQVVKTDRGWEIELDGHMILSKGNNRLVLPSESLAIAVALDWEYMHKRIDLKRMFLYNMASLATDMSQKMRDTHRNALAQIFDTDLLAQRIPEDLPILGQLWSQWHDPAISWFTNELGLEFNDAILWHGVQPEKSRQILKEAIYQLDDWSLLGFSNLTDSTLSIVLSLSLWNRAISAEMAVNATRIESISFEQKWGEGEGSTDLRKQQLLVDIAACCYFLRSLPTNPINRDTLRRKLILNIDQQLITTTPKNRE